MELSLNHEKFIHIYFHSETQINKMIEGGGVAHDNKTI